MLKRFAVIGDHLVNLFPGSEAFLNQSVGMQFHHSGMLSNGLVHQRLGYRRFVGFVVTVAAVADDIDDNVTVIAIAIITGDFRDQYASFRVIAIDVKNGRLNHPRNLGTGTHFSRQRR